MFTDTWASFSFNEPVEHYISESFKTPKRLYTSLSNFSFQLLQKVFQFIALAGIALMRVSKFSIALNTEAATGDAL